MARTSAGLTPVWAWAVVNGIEENNAIVQAMVFSVVIVITMASLSAIPRAIGSVSAAAPSTCLPSPLRKDPLVNGIGVGARFPLLSGQGDGPVRIGACVDLSQLDEGPTRLDHAFGSPP